MQDFINTFKEFWDLPLTEIIGTIFSILICVITILSKTSIGKKLLNKCYSKMQELENKWRTQEKELNEGYKAFKDDITIISEELQDKVSELQAENEKLENLLIQVTENINNKKVAKVIEEYKHGKEQETINNDTTKEEI